MAAAYSDPDLAAWFAVSPVEINDFGEYRLSVERFEDRDVVARIGSVPCAVPIRMDATLVCGDEGDLSVTSVDLPSAAAFEATLKGNREIVAVECLCGN